MGNGGPLGENPKQVIGWSAGSSLGTAIVLYAALSGQQPVHDHSTPSELELDALRRAYEHRLNRIEESDTDLSRKVDPLVQLNHMIPSLRLAVDDNTESVKDLKDEIRVDLSGVDGRVRELEVIVTGLRDVFDEYQRWTEKLSEEGKERERLLRSLEGQTQRLQSTLEQVQGQMKLFDELQRNVRERLGRIQDKVEGYRSQTSGQGNWSQGITRPGGSP